MTPARRLILPPHSSQPTSTRPPAHPFSPLPVEFFRRPADELAPDLLGRYLIRTFRARPGARPRRLVLRIVETEAYLGSIDRASHAFAGRRTPRTQTMYLPGGHAYVYLIYGMYECLNVVAGSADDAHAVLIRAGAPVEGETEMRRRRGLSPRSRPSDLAGGPGRLTRAMGINREFNAMLLCRARGPLRMTVGSPVTPDQIAAGPRIGIDYAQEAVHWPLRFGVRGDPHLSRPLPS